MIASIMASDVSLFGIALSFPQVTDTLMTVEEMVQKRDFDHVPPDYSTVTHFRRFNWQRRHQQRDIPAKWSFNVFNTY